MTRILLPHTLTISAILLFGSSYAAVQAGTCSLPTANSLDCRMDNGARWELSWQNHPQKGLVLNQVILTAKSGAPRTLILEQASLAQVLVAYDNNVNPSQNLHQLNNGLPLSALNDATDCQLAAGVNRLKDGSGTTRICQLFMPRGYAWRGTGQIQGEQLVLFGASAAGSDTYIQQWVFTDDGTIMPLLGVGGQLDASRNSTSATGWQIGPSGSSRYATNRFHTAYWRLDFALGGQSNDLFQQLNYTAGTSKLTYSQSITDVTTENKFTISPENHRFWLVKDTVISNASNGQKISYEIILANTAVQRGSDAFTSADIYLTQGGGNKACEQYASLNPASPAYGDGTPCANGLAQFVNGETVTDPIVWAGTTWHQIPRAEDETNSQVHWQGILLAPRDLTPTSPFN